MQVRLARATKDAFPTTADAQHRAQRRTTRGTSRTTIPENAPSTRPGATRATSKIRAGTGAGLSVAHSQDSNVHTANGPNLKSGKAISIAKDGEGASTSSGSHTQAAIKRKREGLAENATKVTKSSKVPVAASAAPGQENQQVKRGSAYVEVPTLALRSRTTATTATSSRGVTASATVAAGRRRIVVKRDEDVAPPPPAAGSAHVKKSDSPDAHTRDAMSIDEKEPAGTRSARKASVRSSTHSSSTATTTSRRVTASSRRPTAPAARELRRTIKKEEVIEDEVVAQEPQHKKRRTSSVGPDEKEAHVLHEHDSTPVMLSDHHDEAIENAGAEEAKWDDLDAEDEGDPLMVSEYVNEIVVYLRKLELSTMPNPNYIDNQKDLAWKMRGILMDWLIQVHARFRLLPETLFLAVNIVDRFLSTRVVSLVRLQLVGITAMFIAAKYEEILAPSVSNFIYCSDSTYTDKDILDAERYILRSIDYNLSYPNPIHFLRRASKADGYDLQVRTIAKYLIEIACVDWRLLSHPPSRVAAAGVWLSRLILEKGDWVRVTLTSFFVWMSRLLILSLPSSF